MVYRKKTPLQESEGEKFSDFSDDSASSKASSIEDPIKDGWVFPVVRPDARRAEYEAALKEAQLKVSDLQITIRKLHMQNADLAMRLKESKGGSTASGGKKSKVSESDSRVSQFAKHFGVMHEPFVPPSALLVERPDTTSRDPRRYESELSKVKGITAELYEVLPNDMHSEMKSSPKFRNTFTTQLSNGRRSLVYQLRSKTAHEIFGQPSKYYAVDFKREDIQDFQAKLKFPGQEYKKFAPILFPDGKRDLTKLFKCVELTKMLKSILFGPSSLNSRKPPSPVTQGKVWGTIRVTPGAIAFMAVLAIFLHSPDKEFAPVGAKSNIPYENWFGKFKAYLMDNAQKKQIVELYMWWNGWVFAFEKAPKLNDTDNEGSSGMDEAVECLDDNMQVPMNQQDGWQENDNNLMENFNTLAVSVTVAVQESSSGSSKVPQAAILSSFAPGPSHPDSVDQQDSDTPILEPQAAAREKEITGKGKGKEKAVDINEEDMQVKKSGGRPRRRPKKIV